MSAAWACVTPPGKNLLGGVHGHKPERPIGQAIPHDQGKWASKQVRTETHLSFIATSGSWFFVGLFPPPTHRSHQGARGPGGRLAQDGRAQTSLGARAVLCDCCRWSRLPSPRPTLNHPHRRM